MAEIKDTHIVDIPVEEEKELMQHHPLMEISQSAGHLLLLKLWQREEDQFGRRIARKESRLNSIKREIFQLCSFLFLFHFLSIIILFTSSSVNYKHQICKKWWIPSLVSLSTSIVFVILVQVKLFGYWKVQAQLLREKNANRAVTRCILELRMKGDSFDLSKEPLSGKRMKSSSVEIKWRPITWLSNYVITLCLVCFVGLMLPASRFILC